MNGAMAIGLVCAVAAGPGSPAATPEMPAASALVLRRPSAWSEGPHRSVALTASEAPVRRATVTFPIGDNVEVIAIGSKERAPKHWQAVRRTNGPTGRAQASKGARVGLLVKW